MKRSFRSLKTNHADFLSNDYLSIARSEKLKSKIAEGLMNLEKIGSTGSRYISGNSDELRNTEKMYAEHFSSDKAILFSSCFEANYALMEVFVNAEDLVLYDQSIHASFSFFLRYHKNKMAFKHNDLKHLEKKLQGKKGKIFFLMESLYSMDGDGPDLELTSFLCEKYRIQLILDESHAVGIWGERGEGRALMHPRTFSLGKALGVSGGCLLLKENDYQKFVNMSLRYRYTTAPSPIFALTAKSALQTLQEDFALKIQTLKENCRHYFSSMGIEQDFFSPIIPYFSSRQNLLFIQERAKILNLELFVALSPTVPSRSERLRISLHAHNTFSEIDRLVEVLRDFRNS